MDGRQLASKLAAYTGACEILRAFVMAGVSWIRRMAAPMPGSGCQASGMEWARLCSMAEFSRDSGPGGMHLELDSFVSRTVTNLKASMPGIESTDLVRTPGLMALLRRASISMDGRLIGILGVKVLHIGSCATTTEQ
ncbi:unnamed protein product [Symbiodinium pilosum]|uniref:Uncharacterized protein n=1 Tax=Symbiodinium pilosum TaxID=2952 RepID=A0A812QQR3_SYMPI|nr:unnamed protein product [Symbiodinium pilosum]